MLEEEEPLSRKMWSTTTSESSREVLRRYSPAGRPVMRKCPWSSVRVKLKGPARSLVRKLDHLPDLSLPRRETPVAASGVPSSTADGTGDGGALEEVDLGSGGAVGGDGDGSEEVGHEFGSGVGRVVEVFAGELGEGRKVADLFGDNVIVAGMDVGNDEGAVEEGLDDFGGGFGLEVFALPLECGGGEIEDGLEDDGGDAGGEGGSSQRTRPVTVTVGAGCWARAVPVSRRQSMVARIGTTPVSGSIAMYANAGEDVSLWVVRTNLSDERTESELRQGLGQR